VYWLRPVTLRLMIPARRHDPPTWEVTVDGRVIGWLTQRTLGNSSSIFIHAVGVYKPNGKRIDLEYSTDFRERLEKLIEFDQDPERFRGLHLH